MNLKTRLLLLLWTISTGIPALAQIPGNLEVAILSDLHILHPSLLQEGSETFEQYIQHDRKLLRQGPTLLQTAVRQLLRQPQRPHVVLIPGDLTKDGERISHQWVADSLLRPLREAGIQVYVVPGNHDINNPHAVCYKRDTTYRTATVTASEFADIYQDYGYGSALARDPHSLSYVVALNDTLRLLAIDACRYAENDFERNTCVTGGRIRPETLDFIEAQATAARQTNCRLVAMMHHGLVRHFTWQDRILGDYLVADWKQQAKTFGRLGIHHVFTGHFHAQDIACYGKGKRRVFDIETGSTVSYPMPVRYVRFTPGQLHIRSAFLSNDENLPHASELEAEAVRYARAGVGTLITDLLPDKVPAAIKQEVGALVGEAYQNHLAGDETLTEDFKKRLKKGSRRLRPYSWKFAFALKRFGHHLCTDTSPEDNQTFLPF